METDLRNKTVLDFTQDKQLLCQILSIPINVDYDEYIDFYLESCHPVNRLADIATLAQMTGDDKLEQQAQNLYIELMDKFVNETVEVHTTTGMLVD